MNKFSQGGTIIRRQFTALVTLASPRLTLAAAIVTLFLLALAPLLVLREHAWINVHDNLDSQLVWYASAVRAGPGFVLGLESSLPNVMNGLPRSLMTTLINVISLWFFLLPPFWAYVLNTTVIRIVAFIGCFALLRRVTGDSPQERSIAIWLALLFAMLPFFPLGGVTSAGLPLLLHSYLSIEAGRARWYHWLVAAAFPFYSSLYLVGIFLVAALAARVAFLALTRRPGLYRAVAFLAMIGIGYGLAEWATILPILAGTAQPTHRVAINPQAFVEQSKVMGMLSEFRLLLSDGGGHAGTVHVWPIVLALIVGFPQLRSSGRMRAIAWLLTGIVAIAAFAAFQPVITRYLGPHIPFVTRFHFSRLYFFLPVMWFVVFAIVLTQLVRVPYKVIVVPILLLLQMASISRSNKEVVYNVLKLAGSPSYHPTYGEFFDEDLFGRVRAAIGADPATYRVAAVGLHPSILQYNGFYTLDSYQTMYPLDYKLKFREIIAPELERDEALRVYFDAWGSRCYVFSSEFGNDFMRGKDHGRMIGDLAIDLDKLRALGARYLISSAPIMRIAGAPSSLVGTFDTPRSYWRIFLYDVSAGGPPSAALPQSPPAS